LLLPPSCFDLFCSLAYCSWSLRFVVVLVFAVVVRAVTCQKSVAVPIRVSYSAFLRSMRGARVIWAPSICISCSCWCHRYFLSRLELPSPCSRLSIRLLLSPVPVVTRVRPRLGESQLLSDGGFCSAAFFCQHLLQYLLPSHRQYWSIQESKSVLNCKEQVRQCQAL
jgi:hypothetical protein